MSQTPPTTSEILAKFSNPAWRIRNLYHIINKDGEKVKYKPNPIQEICNQQEAKRIAILKARQFGISTNEIIKLFDYCIWNQNKTVCIIAHEQDSIKKLFRIVRRLYNFLPKNIKPEIDRGGGSKYELFFPEINSRIYCDLESRGDTISRLLVSEVAFMKDPSKLKSTLQAVPITSGRVTLESTPNGMNHFYDLWMDENAPYKKLFFPWFMFPDYKLETERFQLTKDEIEIKQKHNLTMEQMAFRRLKLGELKELFVQEYPEDDQSCFLSSGNTVFNLDAVKQRLENVVEPIISDGVFEIYQKYDKTHRYVCGADTAEGIGHDYSVGTLFDLNTMEQVACVRGHYKPSEFASLLNNLCLSYTAGGRPHPLLAVERNNHGHAVLLELEEHLRYPNLYKAKDKRTGWITDKVTRPIMLNAFRDALENETVKFNHKETLKECFTFVNINGKLTASDGKHDDCIMASAIAIQMLAEYKHMALYDNIGLKIKV